MSRGPMSLPTSQLDPEASAVKERDIISSHRLKLAEYIHDVTLLFPHMKERYVFTTDDCDIIANEVPSTLKVDKFVDVLLTKGPKAIGVFHESLDAQYPAMFDYLSRLLTNAGVQLPSSRQLKDREAESGPKSPPIGGPSRPSTFQRHGSKTVRKSLEVLSRQFEVMQQERGELHEQLIKREQEIGSLLDTRKSFQSDLLQVTQKYQQMLSELVDWRRILSNQSEGGNQKFQELLAEREQVQQEYDDLEGEVMLVSSELSAARDRISRLRAHLERSEQVHSLEKEKLKDKLERQIAQQHRQIQRLSRKLEQLSSIGRVPTSNGDEEVTAEDKCAKLQFELEQSREDCCDLTERLEVAHIERKDAIVEKDDNVFKYHTEKERRKRADKQLRGVHRYLDSQGLLNSLSPTTPPYSTPSPSLNVRVEELTVSIPVSIAEGHGMVLDCGVIVTDLVENGLSVAHGVRPGDEIRQVNSINLCSDRDPLEFASRLLDSAAQSITLTIRRQVPAGYHLFQAPPTSSLATPTSSLLFNPLDPQAPARRTSTEHPSFLPVHLLRPSSVPAPRKVNRFSNVNSAYAEKSHDQSHDDQTTSSEGRAPSVSEESGVDSSEPGSVSDSERPAGLMIARGSPRHISQLSQDSEGSGLYCTSPSACACERDSMELPDIITLRPTLMSQHPLPEPRPSVLREEGEEENYEVSDNDVCPLQQSPVDSAHTRPHTDSVTTNSGTDDSVKSYPGHRSRLPWQSKSVDKNLGLDVSRQFSEPDHSVNEQAREQPRFLAELESEDEAHLLHRTPVIRRPIRRHRISKEERMKRISRSLDDLSRLMMGHQEVILTPVLPTNSEDGNLQQVRRVLLPQGQLGANLHLIGGRGTGIFIHSERQNTEDGLHSGDQLTKVDSKSVDNMTYAEVLELLESYSLKRWQCIITVQQNLEGYSKVPKHMRDNFYVRAKYSHTKRSGLRNELLFDKGTIFNVVDTLPTKQKGRGVWRVSRINAKGEVVEAGFVPTKLSTTELQLESVSGSLPRFLHSFSPKLIRRNGAVTLDPHTQRMSASLGFQLFEPIREVKVTDPRPVVLLGALEVDVRRYVVEHGSTTDIKFSYCKREPLDELEHVKEKDFVEMTTIDGQEMRSTASHVQELAGQGYHCVLCFQRPEELDRPIMAVFCPIVILLDTTSTRTVNKIRASVPIPADRIDNPLLHLERIKEVKKYMHIITGRVELSGSMTMWDVVTTVRSVVQRQQESIVWEIEDS